MIRPLASLGFWMVAACAGPAAWRQDVRQDVRLDQVQMIGTHNSYHIAPDAVVFELMRRTKYQESPRWTADALAQALDYTHPPLSEQLQMGLRVFELDVHDDPEGGRFSPPGLIAALGPAGARNLPALDPNGDLEKPGFKVFHAADTDMRSTCLLLRACLQAIAIWLRAHPEEGPIIVQIETKEGAPPPLADAYPPRQFHAFDTQAWARLHQEIAAVFTREEIVTPDEVRGRHATLNQAVRKQGWPHLTQLRGRILFLLLDDPPKQQDYAHFSRRNAPTLFVSRAADDPDTGWLIRPKPNVEEIRALVKQGFLVYTRADAHGEAARSGDDTRAQAALTSGAQMIATDYPRPDPRFSRYQVSFDGAYFRQRSDQ